MEKVKKEIMDFIAEQMATQTEMMLAAIRNEKGKDHLVSREETAVRLHVNTSTLWRWKCDGYLIPVKIGGHVWYREADIIKILKGEWAK